MHFVYILYAYNLNRYYIGATKRFTATVLGIALKEGKIDNLNDLVEKYATQFNDLWRNTHQTYTNDVFRY